MTPKNRSVLICLGLFFAVSSHAFTAPLHLAARSATGLPSSSSRLQQAPGQTSEADSQNIFGILSDAFTGAAFGFLHAFDPDPISDSSKNLRVLWVRALLNQRGMIQDDVAEKFLPPTTRGLVTTEGGSRLFDPIVKFTEWIQARTDFIDNAVDHFLTSPACTNESGNAVECNIVLFGAGYDTRSLRFRHAHDDKINFMEVDLPDVCAGKEKLYAKFRDEHDPTWDLEGKGPKLVPFDLNDCGGDSPVGIIDTLREKGGLQVGVPTLFVSEAVLFYVNEDAIRNMMPDIFQFCSPEGNNGAECMVCMTDSLKPFVSVPFTNEASIFFDKTANMDLLEHRSRWGGAVHFCLAASRSSKTAQGQLNQVSQQGKIAQHISSRVDGLVKSYTPTQSNNQVLLKKPSFDKVWYAVAYTWQIDGYETPLDAVLGRKTSDGKPFGTRLWGEPIVIYRDSAGELVATADVCPHRSVPLSMGKVENGELVCFYHGWRFGKGGECVNIPTLNTVDEDANVMARTGSSNFLKSVTKTNCGNNRAVVEHDGLVYVWRGNVLEADPSLLPTRRKGDMETVTIDTVLDYAVDYSYIVENNLDSPHLFFLHDGSIPPIESIGMKNSNLPKLKLKAFTDDCGMGHLGSIEKDGRPKKLIRFDPPNIVRHGGVSGFEEEFQIIPVAPHRTRVLLRQHLPRGPILSTITGIPLVRPILTLLVNNWNYHIALEDSCVMQGQANRIEDWGSPRMAVGGLGDDLIKRFWDWRREAHEACEPDANGISSPYFVDFSQNGAFVKAQIASGTSFGDQPSLVSKVREFARLRSTPIAGDNNEIDATGNPIGTWGIKRSYLQDTPAANFPPTNYQQYKKLLVFDKFVKDLFKGDDEDQIPNRPVTRQDSLPTPTPQDLEPVVALATDPFFGATNKTNSILSTV